MASGVGCLVAGLVEMQCRGWEDLYLVAGPVETSCRGWEAGCLVAEFAEMHCLDLEAVEEAGDIEQAWG